MATQDPTTEKKYNKNIISIIALAIGTGYFLGEFFWKHSFVWGRIGGIYWLFVFMDKTAMDLAGIFLTSSVILLVICVGAKLIRNSRCPVVAKTSAALFLSAVLLASTIFMIFPQNTIHLDTLEVKGKVFYLSVDPMFDDNYGLYQCDATGIFCKQVYRSGDYTAGFYGHLDYHPESNQIAVVVNGEGVIYMYDLPIE